jgi:hypothetical protein
MAKYQFFCQPGKERQNFTFLVMGTETFLEEKAQLLNSGLEVDGDVIFASTDREAIEKYTSHFTHLTEEMNNSHPESAAVNAFLQIAKAINQRWLKR